MSQNDGKILYNWKETVNIAHCIIMINKRNMASMLVRKYCVKDYDVVLIQTNFNPFTSVHALSHIGSRKRVFIASYFCWKCKTPIYCFLIKKTLNKTLIYIGKKHTTHMLLTVATQCWSMRGWRSAHPGFRRMLYIASGLIRPPSQIARGLRNRTSASVLMEQFYLKERCVFRVSIQA